MHFFVVFSSLSRSRMLKIKFGKSEQEEGRRAANTFRVCRGITIIECNYSVICDAEEKRHIKCNFSVHRRKKNDEKFRQRKNDEITTK